VLTYESSRADQFVLRKMGSPELEDAIRRENADILLAEVRGRERADNLLAKVLGRASKNPDGSK
jgi:hypothetical protein